MDIFYTNVTYNDGFGSQYQKILQTYIFCKMNNLNFAYLPLNYVEHNYNNDKDFNKVVNAAKNGENELLAVISSGISINVKNKVNINNLT